MAKKIGVHGTDAETGRGKEHGAKKECAIPKERFLGKATPLAVSVGGIPQAAMPKEFQTGSFGWFLNGKTVVEVDGIAVPVQMNCILTVIGSKVA